MPVTIETLERKFLYNGTELPDPNPALSADACREIFAQTHPELANAAIEGPDVRGNVQTFKFIRSVGTKG